MVQGKLQHLQSTFAAILKEGGILSRHRSVKGPRRAKVPRGAKGPTEGARRAKGPNGYTHALYKIWHRCYLDKKEFGQQKILLTQGDIQRLCQAQCQPLHARLHVVPRQPRQPLSRENALLVDKVQRRFLLALWRMTRNEEEYRCRVGDLKRLDS